MLHVFAQGGFGALLGLLAMQLPMQGALADEVAVATLKNGKDVYAAVCSSCHDGGIAGAPKIRDKSAWSARLAEGMGLLYLHSLKGYTGKFGVMPARGGRADLPTELVKQAVDYMVSVSN